MRNSVRRTIIITASIMAVLVAFNGLRFHGWMGQWGADVTANMLAPLTSRLSWLTRFGAVIAQHRDVASENLVLRDDIAQLQGQLAQADQLKADAATYKAAAALKERGKSTPILAAVFSLPTAGGLHSAVLNRGSHDGVAVGDVVVSPQGAVIGLVRTLYPDHALVNALGDPSLQLAGRVVAGTATGLVRTDSEGLLLDLVKKDEGVREGQLVATSGNDQFPAGFVIGTVRSVDVNQATLFAIVRLESAVAQPFAGAVVVIHP